ncbi:aminoglycoside phosphotransferase family protein [Micromonospora sp. WMMD812]|uniref:phosphotransferase family protein n=1 Tax=Micromonospora sp. WMMD812 TaxID=3015152 RepID=UPI00248A90F6|nr:aminoglycoside phosphotransferase family protein [Micromonospora sp. WMMD812]WBB68098.1 aminoglycoside phosphotransferase family protein [Micromonospora sp. WMMD812]
MNVVSPTQRAITSEDVSRLIRASFGPAAAVADCGPLHGGGFAAVWWVRLDDDRRVVLKVAPPDALRLLRYERGLCAAEDRYFRLVADRAPRVPVPPVLHHGVDPAYGEWLVTGLLPGRSLADLAADGVADGPARYDLGGALAALHRVTGDRFGYEGDRPSGSTWREAYAAMVDALLADAADWNVRLPVPPERVRALVRRHGPLLDAVRRPALLHFDCWDGNVLAAPAPDGRLRLSGLVDGERYLYGDPLMDLVSPLLGRRAEDEPDHQTLRGYRTAEPFDLDGAARRRLSLYRLYLYLLMTVEMPSRGMNPESHPDRAALLDAELAALGRA